MIKTTFIYIVVIVLVGITVWFLIQKSKSSSNNDLNSLSATEEPSPTATLASDNNSNGSDWIKLPSGLQIKDITVGYGTEAREGDVVAAHYIGTLADGTKFDSSYDHGQPFSFILGGGMVIKGWDLGLVGMKVGGKRKLIIPPDLGYGDRSVGGIPANSTLYFDVELMSVQTQSAK